MERLFSNEGSTRFRSRLGLILSVLGIAVGTGNIWRFPRIVAQNSTVEGGGGFLIAWLLCLFMWSIPLMIAEYGLGKSGRMGVIGSIQKAMGGRHGWLGGFVAFVATAILFYYSVVTAWCLYYFGQLTFVGLPPTMDLAMDQWNGFQASNWPVVLHGVIIAAGSWIVYKGIGTIERVNKVLIPSLLLIILIALVRALSLPNAGEGIAFLFTPDLSVLKEPTVWLEALTQNAWDTGAAWGLILTYAAYMRSQDSVVQSAFITGIGNNIVSLIAAGLIFSTVFGTLSATQTHAEIIDIMKTSGPASTGLTFIWMPQLFEKMVGGRWLGSLFFLGLTMAAFSSLISMIALAQRVFKDVGAKASHAAWGVGLAAFAFGIPSAVNLTIFENQDFVWGVGLMVSGAIIAFAVNRQSAKAFYDQHVHLGGDSTPKPSRLRGIWVFLIKWVIPIEVATLLIWWLTRTIFVYAPDTWYNPLDPFSLATVLGQWAIAACLLYLFRRRLEPKSRGVDTVT